MKTLVLTASFLFSATLFSGLIESFEAPPAKDVEKQNLEQKRPAPKEQEDGNLERGPSSIEIKEVEYILPPRPWNYKGREY